MDQQQIINTMFHFLHNISERMNDISQIEAIRERDRILSLDRFKKYPKRLINYGYKVYSMNDQDGIIAHIFDAIGTTNKHFVEFGADEGIQNNSHFLLSMCDWSGLWIEADKDKFAKMCNNFSNERAKGKLRCINQFVTRDNIDSLIKSNSPARDVDFLSIDIDWNEYYIWKAINWLNPRVVSIEYNAHIPAHIAVTVPYSDNHTWNGTNTFGVSLKALEILGNEKGYYLVGCNITGTDAFFIRKDIIDGYENILKYSEFHYPFTSENHYEPPRFKMVFHNGHPDSVGNWVPINKEKTKDE